MQANNNGPSPWRHASTAYGILQLKREQLEQPQAKKTDADRFHEEALRRFWERVDKPDQ